MRNSKALWILAGCLVVFTGCSVVSANRVFPKLTWYWQWEAKAQRAERRAEKEWARTNAPDVKRGGEGR